MVKKRELLNMGFTKEKGLKESQRAVGAARTHGHTLTDIREDLQLLVKNPSSYTNHEIYGQLACLRTQLHRQKPRVELQQVPYHVWGKKGIDDATLAQMDAACSLPISVAGALMPDAHLGYGLPVGGVLATSNAVIPYAVGNDIGCRVKISILDTPCVSLEKNTAKFSRALEERTRFGTGVRWEKKQRKDHEVLDRNWGEYPLLKELKDLAWSQLGTSGSGNHFVEFGTLTLTKQLGEAHQGTYVALVSHSGSRGPGGKTASYYTKLARKIHAELPSDLRHLAWLSLDSQEGAQYWDAMELMGDYASANHDIIHKNVLQYIGARVLYSVENHHNFAWREHYHGQELIIHRKGATPAQKGVLGYIPGTMSHPGYIVEGKGEPLALHSSAHGAGRVMSRKKARQTVTRHAMEKALRQQKITLLSAGLDESPHAYKDITEVMKAQRALVEMRGTFTPRVVKMAPPGEKPED